jgi:hypothetical protein
VSYDPLSEFEALAVGGQAPACYVITPTQLIVGLEDVSELETAFTFNAAEVTQELQAIFFLISPAGHSESLLALVMKLTSVGSEVCLLMWVNSMREALRCLLETKSIMLTSRHALGSTAEPEAQSELVAFDLSEIDFRPVETILEQASPELRSVSGGWRMDLGAEAGVEAAIEAVTFDALDDYRLGLARMGENETDPNVLLWANESLREVGAVGSEQLVGAFLAGLPGASRPAEIPRERAFVLWRNFAHHLSQYLTAQGLGQTIRPSPTVAAKRVARGGRAVTAFVIAYAYPDYEASKRCLDQLKAEMLATGESDYVCRLRYENEDEDAASPWIVLALTFSLGSKAKLAFRDWGPDAAPVSSWIGEDTIRQALKGAGLNPEDLSLSDVPSSLDLR